MKKIVLNGIEYELIKDERKVFNEQEVVSKCTDYFVPFDYIVGDYSYEKLRLKGFYDKNNKKVSKINNIENLDDYVKNYCAYGEKYFLLKKMK